MGESELFRKLFGKLNVGKRKKSKIVIRDITDPDDMFAELEKVIQRYNYIRVADARKWEILQLSVEAFCKKYACLITSVKECGQNLIIQLRDREKDKTGHYIEVQEEYDENYYMADCGGYHEFIQSDGRILDHRLEQMFLLCEPNNQDTILDIGCGRGELTFALSKSAKKVVGIDYSQAAIDIANKYFGNKTNKNLTYICGDIMSIDVSEKYNKIIMADVYEHIEAEVMENLLERVSYLLTDDGMLFIHTAPNLDYYETVYSKMVKEEREKGRFLPKNPRSRYEDRMHINEQSTGSLRNTLKRYFPDVYVWTGEIHSIDELKHLNKQNITNEITAIAGTNIDNYQVFDKLHYSKLNPNDICVRIISKDKVEVSLEETMIRVPITVENNGYTVLKSQMPYPVYISYHILNKEGQTIVFDGRRTALGSSIYAGDTLEVLTLIDVGVDESDFIVVVTLVQENNFWFCDLSEDYLCRIEVKKR